MPIPSEDERRSLLVTTTFGSDAFLVSRGEKTKWMLELEQDRAAAVAASRLAQGLAASGPKPPPPPPDPIPLGGLGLLASVLKLFVEDDAALAAATKIQFKAHFTGVLTQGQLLLEPACDATWDAALPKDPSFKDLIAAGMDRHGELPGVDSLGRWVRSATYGACMPNGGLEDDYVCVVNLLRMDKELAGGKIEFNEMECAITIDRVRAEDGLTISKLRMAIGETYSVRTHGKRNMRRFVPSEISVYQALEMIARENKYHESREYLLGLKDTWDGVNRSADLLSAIGGRQVPSGGESLQELLELGAANDLAEEQLRKTLLGTVWRTFEPGCQMDTMLVLKSKQGTKKSSLFRTLAPAGKFSDVHIEFGSKDAMMLMQQNTWYECAELSGMVKKEMQVVKAFITNRWDDFRLPYGKIMTRNPRHCVLVGTTNDDTPLKDATGSRRFWVILISDETKINIPWIQKIKPQVWAEMVHLYFEEKTCAACATNADGETRCPKHRWWLTPEEDLLREKVNERFTEQEPFVGWLQDFINNAATDKSAGAKQGLHVKYKNTDVLRTQDLLEAAGFPPEKCLDAGLQRRMVYALKRTGYVSKRLKTGSVWISPGMKGRPFNLVLVPNNKEDDKEEDAEITKNKTTEEK